MPPPTSLLLSIAPPSVPFTFWGGVEATYRKAEQPPRMYELYVYRIGWSINTGDPINIVPIFISAPPHITNISYKGNIILYWFQYTSCLCILCFIISLFRCCWCVFFLSKAEQPPGMYEVAKEKPSPRFMKTQLPMEFLPREIEEKKPKIVYVSRNPKDNAVSYFNFCNLTVNCPQYKVWSEFLHDFTRGASMLISSLSFCIDLLHMKINLLKLIN